MKNKIDIKPFNESHLEQVCLIEKDTFAIPWSKRELQRDTLENERSIYFVAMEETKVIGFAGMWHVVNEGHITNVAVCNEYRSQGIGTKLIEALIKIAKEKEMIGITLEVRISNIFAQQLYTKLGFKPEGFRKNYYKDTNEDAIIMWLWF